MAASTPARLVTIIAALAIFGAAGCVPITPTARIEAPTATNTPLPPGAPAPGAAGIGDPYYPELGNGGYDVQHYTLVLDVQPADNVISSTATIEAKATQSLSSFNLDFVGLTIDEVLVNGQAANYDREGHELVITPELPLPVNEDFTIVVAYHGSPMPVESLVGGIEVGWFSTEGDTINVLSEPDGAASWFPVNDHPRDKASYRFEVTVPAEFTVAASGYLRERVEHDQQVTYIWEMDKPLASYLAAINIGKYEVETESGPDGVALRSYFPPGTSRVDKQHYAELPEMIEFFSNLFGPYPFDAYGILIADPEIAICHVMTAAEIQTMSTHCPGFGAASEIVIVHELAHQWFGDSVSLENWQDVWLKEGSTTYAEWLWSEKGEPRSAVTAIANSARRALNLRNPIAQPPADNLYNGAIYVGGALVFHALRLEVGDEAFFQILRTDLERFQYGNAGTDEFIALAEEVSGESLDDFFQSWLYSEELPALPDVE